MSEPWEDFASGATTATAPSSDAPPWEDFQNEALSKSVSLKQDPNLVSTISGGTKGGGLNLQPFTKADLPDASDIGELYQDVSRPAVKLPKFTIDPKDSKIDAVAKSAANLIVSVPEFMESPLGVATAGSASVLPKVVAALFLGDTAKNVVEGSKEAGKNWDEMTDAEKAATATDLAGQTVLAAAMAHGAAGGVADAVDTRVNPAGMLARELNRTKPKMGPTAAPATIVANSDSPWEDFKQPEAPPAPTEAIAKPTEETAPPTEEAKSPVDTLGEGIDFANIQKPHLVGIEAGLNLTPDDVPALKERQKGVSDAMVKAAETGEDFQPLFGEATFLGGAIEAANKKGPNWDLYQKMQAEKSSPPPEAIPTAPTETVPQAGLATPNLTPTAAGESLPTPDSPDLLTHGDEVQAILPNGSKVQGHIIGADDAGNSVLLQANGKTVTLPEKLTEAPDENTKPENVQAAETPPTRPVEEIPVGKPGEVQQPAENPLVENPGLPPQETAGGVEANPNPVEPEPALVAMGADVHKSADAERGGGSPTAMKYRLIDEERQKRGLPPIAKPESVSDQASMDKAMAAIDQNPAAPEDLVKSLIAKPRSIDAWERMLLLVHKIGLRDAYERSAREGIQAYDDSTQFPDRKSDMVAHNVETARLSDLLSEVEQASRLSGSEQGRGLRALRVMANEDFSLAGLEMQRRAAKGFEPLTDAERAELVKTADDYRKSNDELQAHLTQRDQKISELEAQKTLAETQRTAEPPIEPHIRTLAESIMATLKTQGKSARERIAERKRQGRTYGTIIPIPVEELVDYSIIGAELLARASFKVADWTVAMKKEFGDALQPHFQQILEASKKRLSGMMSPSNAPKVIRALKTAPLPERQAEVLDGIRARFDSGKLDELTPLVQKLAKLAVEGGAKGWRAITDAVHAQLKQIVPELDYRDTMDAISGHGRFSQMAQDAVSKELRDAKSQINEIRKIQEVIAGEPVKPTGLKREPPSDAKRRLTQLYEEMKRRFGVVVTDPAVQLRSALQARKTYYENRISDLQHEIDAKKRTLKVKTPSPTDAALESLKAEYDRVKVEHDKIFGDRTLTDEQRLKMAMGGVERQIADFDRRIKESDFSSKKTRAVKDTPELAAAKARRDALKEQFQQMRDLDEHYAREEGAKQLEKQKAALEKAIAEKEKQIASRDVTPVAQKVNRPMLPELEMAKQRMELLNKQIRELRNPTKSPEERALQAFKTRTVNRIAELESKIASGDVAPNPKRKPPVVDREAQELTAKKEAVVKKFKSAQKKYELDHKPRMERIFDFLSNVRRFSVLSGVHVLGKLAAYSVTKVPVMAATEGLAGIARHVPFVKEVAARAPTEGTARIDLLAKSIAKGLTQGFKDAYEMATKGQSQLKSAFSTRVENPYAWYMIPQLIHEIIKSPLRRTAFELSLSKRMAFGEAHGVDVTDPLVQLAYSKDAYLDADRTLLLEQNRMANGVRGLFKQLENPDKATGKTPPIGKFLATVGRIEFPILTVPFNFVKQTLMSAFGLVSGSYKLHQAFANGIETLKPEEADAIMRHLKYGTIGGAILLYGFFDGWNNGANGTFGGYYQPGKKRTDKETPFSGMKVEGHNVPGFILHNPMLAVGQFGHTIGAIANTKLKHDTQTHGVTAGTVAAMMGLLNDSPLGRQVELVSQLSDPRSMDWALGEHIKGLLIPQLMNEIAQFGDKNAAGKVVQRDPKTILQHIETGIPGLREKIPKK